MAMKQTEPVHQTKLYEHNWNITKNITIVMQGSVVLIKKMVLDLTRLGRVAHLPVNKLTIIGADNAWPARNHCLN